MPSPTPAKCRGPMVRQLSLQSPVHLSKIHKLRKQLSAEDDRRVLDTVEVTGQGWTVVSRSDSMIKLNFGDVKSKVGGSRPKPAKVAWMEKKQDSMENPLGVEVVATKCQGQPRPLSIKTQRFRTPLIGNKDTLAYTRLQLAERLRSAWSEREKTKPNINIFLAHASNTSRSDNVLSETQDNSSVLSDTVERKRKPLQMRAFSQEYCPSDLFQDKLEISPYAENAQDNDIPNPSNDEATTNDYKADKSVTNDQSVHDLPCHQELSKIEIRVSKTQRDPTNDSANKENINTSTEYEFKEDEKDQTDSTRIRPVNMSAKDRRACFRSRSFLNKTITDSFSLPSEDESPVEAQPDTVKYPVQKRVLVRALSAPSHDQNPQKPTTPSKSVKFLPPQRLQSVITFDSSDASQEDVTVVRERIKSAPIRRKLKSAVVRRKNKEKGDSSSEDEAKEASTKSKKATKRGTSKNGNDIVTMVSLVSPAESDIEDSVINLPLQSLPVESEKRDVKTEAKTSGEETKTVSFDIQKFVTLRKTTKTVTFQTNPVLTRNYSASFPSRRAPAGTPIIIPSPVISNPALTPAQLQERDKRPPTVFGGPDGRGIKRRLIRSPSEPAKESENYSRFVPISELIKPEGSPMKTELGESRSRLGNGDVAEREESEDKSKPRPSLSIYVSECANYSEKVTEKNQIEEPEDGEFQFKCPKEKECWALYKKMVANGVSVTFDTVLRGMLTPTEYRLKKNRLLSTC